jgi:hypothetical protein
MDSVIHWADLKYKGHGGFVFSNRRLTDFADYVAIDYNGEHLILKDRHGFSGVVCGLRMAIRPIVITSELIEGADELYDKFKWKLVNVENLNYRSEIIENQYRG